MAAKVALAQSLVEPEHEPAAHAPERVGEFQVTVLHDLTPAVALQIVQAVLEGERSIVLAGR